MTLEEKHELYLTSIYVGCLALLCSNPIKLGPRVISFWLRLPGDNKKMSTCDELFSEHHIWNGEGQRAAACRNAYSASLPDILLSIDLWTISRSVKASKSNKERKVRTLQQKFFVHAGGKTICGMTRLFTFLWLAEFQIVRRDRGVEGLSLSHDRQYALGYIGSSVLSLAMSKVRA